MNASFLRFVLCAGCVSSLILSGVGFAQDARVPAATERIMSRDTSLIITKDQVRKTRFALKGWKGDLKDAQIIDLAGKDISGLLTPKTENGTVTLAQPMQPFIMKTRMPQKVVLNEISDTSSL